MDRIEAFNPPVQVAGGEETWDDMAWERRHELMRHIGLNFEPHGHLPKQHAWSPDVFYSVRPMPLKLEQYCNVFYDYALVALYKIRALVACKDIEKARFLDKGLPRELVLEIQDRMLSPCMTNNIDFLRTVHSGRSMIPLIQRLEAEVQSIFDSMSHKSESCWQVAMRELLADRYRRHMNVDLRVEYVGWVPPPRIWGPEGVTVEKKCRFACEDFVRFPEVMEWMRSYVNCRLEKPVKDLSLPWPVWLRVANWRLSLSGDLHPHGVGSIFLALDAIARMGPNDIRHYKDALRDSWVPYGSEGLRRHRDR